MNAIFRILPIDDPTENSEEAGVGSRYADYFGFPEKGAQSVDLHERSTNQKP
jgi:hypothetical protein